MAIERKEEIRELWEIVSNYTCMADAPEGFMQRDQHLPVPGITCQFTVTEFYEAIAYSILSDFTDAVSGQEALKKFEETARERLEWEIIENELIPTGNSALTAHNLERMTIKEVYHLGLTLESCFNPDMFCQEEVEVLDGVKMATTLAAYATAGFFPQINGTKARSILTTMLDNYKRYVQERVRFEFATEKTELLAKVKEAYKQIDKVFRGR